MIETRCLKDRVFFLFFLIIFITDKLKFFGIEISSERIAPDIKKMKAIKHALLPSNINELRSFIGLCTYVSRFIDNYSEKKTDALCELLQKNIKFFCEEKHSKAFKKLK